MVVLMARAKKHLRDHYAEYLADGAYLGVVDLSSPKFVAFNTFHSVNQGLKINQVIIPLLFNSKLYPNSPHYGSPIVIAILAIVSEFDFSFKNPNISILIKLFLGGVQECVSFLSHISQIFFDNIITFILIISFFILFWSLFELLCQNQSDHWRIRLHIYSNNVIYNNPYTILN